VLCVLRGSAISYLYMQEISSFSLMMLPSFVSRTANVSPCTCFLRNFFMPVAQENRQVD
jgi:hypothetical protein